MSEVMFEIKSPKYVGELELVKGFSVSLIKMPNKFHQVMMFICFGFKFRKS